jgi:hypothetical protein
MKASLTITHDRLTVRVTDGQNNLNLTVSRNGETASGKGQNEATLRKALTGFSKYLKRKGTGANYKEQFDNLKTLAENNNTIDEFITALS